MIAATPTLARYITKAFLLNFAVLSLILLGIIFVFDIAELLRRAGNLSDVAFGTVLSMAALKLPYVGQQMLPFGVLFSAIYTCWKLNKTHELVIIRAAGLSVWQFLAPLVVAALVIGTVTTTIINPVSSLLLARFDQMEVLHLKKNSNLVTVSRTGIWLRQPVESGYALVHSESFESAQKKLGRVIVFFFDDQDNFTHRIDSPVAVLQDGYWDIRDAIINGRNDITYQKETRLPTDLTLRKIEESFADPETISFWMIPEYIRIMEETGLPVTQLRIHFQSLLAKPFLFAAMILLAATFSLRPPRFGGTTLLIGLGVATGFFIFFLDSMLQAFGLTQKIPVYLAAWTPAVLGLLLGTTALLHLEDG